MASHVELFLLYLGVEPLHALQLDIEKSAGVTSMCGCVSSHAQAMYSGTRSSTLSDFRVGE